MAWNPIARASMSGVSQLSADVHATASITLQAESGILRTGSDTSLSLGRCLCLWLWSCRLTSVSPVVSSQDRQAAMKKETRPKRHYPNRRRKDKSAAAAGDDKKLSDDEQVSCWPHTRRNVTNLATELTS